VLGERPLHGDGTPECQPPIGERDEEPVAGRMCDVAAVSREEGPKGAIVPGEQILPGVVADHPDQVGRPDDVREHERSHDPLRALALEREPIEHAPRSLRTRSSAGTLERLSGRARLRARRVLVPARGVGLR
jgi:hypothetical protein